jgi:hypothetical protein
MYQPLVPCIECRRHLRATEVSCPFCSAPRAATPIAVGSTVRMSRAAAIVAATLAVACQSEPQAVPIVKDPVAVKPSATTAPTAEPVADAGLVDDHGGMVTKYGAPPPPKPHPIAVPAYGLPPPPLHPTPVPKPLP